MPFCVKTSTFWCTKTAMAEAQHPYWVKTINNIKNNNNNNNKEKKIGKAQNIKDLSRHVQIMSIHVS